MSQATEAIYQNKTCVYCLPFSTFCWVVIARGRKKIFNDDSQFFYLSKCGFLHSIFDVIFMPRCARTNSPWISCHRLTSVQIYLVDGPYILADQLWSCTICCDAMFKMNVMWRCVMIFILVHAELFNAVKILSNSKIVD